MPHPVLASPDLIRFEGDTPHLVGSRCDECGEVYFPATDSCTRCTATRMSFYDLGHRGTLWSWTIQGFLPKAPYNSGETPETFRPYGVGYVEMESGLKVESRLTVADEALLQIGMPLELTLIPYRTTGEGEVFTFAFRPSASA
ncbi:MAG: uncharacterized protein AzoDbin1_05213 [Azoarcus sp.]|nr:uncharacterized protein [Azoarcus sp.]